MIYIIFDKSYECDGYDSPSNMIDYITTNKQDAINFFKQYENPPYSDKWHYEYCLVEYNDKYSKFSTERPNILLTSSNDNEK